MQAKKRDRKVEELKMSLKTENDLTVLSTRGELASNRIKDETLNNRNFLTPVAHLFFFKYKFSFVSVSNPPPSPVTDGNRENSSDFDANIIQHVNVTSPDKAASSSKDVAANNVETIANLRLAAESAQLNQQQRAAQQMQSSVADSVPTAYQDDFLDMHCDDMDLF